MSDIKRVSLLLNPLLLAPINWPVCKHFTERGKLGPNCFGHSHSAVQQQTALTYHLVIQLVFHGDSQTSCDR